MTEIPDEPMTPAEIQAVLDGQDLKTYRAERKVHNRIHDESLHYMNSDPKNWPDIEINWDTDPSSQRYSLDGCKES